MKKAPTILSYEQLEALASPMRSEVFQRVRALGTASVSDVATELNSSPESIAYHFRLLVKVGLLRSIEKRPTKRRAEVVYEPSSTSYRLPNQSEDSEGHKLSHKVVVATLRQTARNFSRVSEAINDDQPELSTKLHIIRSHIRLNIQDREKFFDLIDQAERFARDASDPDSHDAEALNWLSLVTPKLKTKSDG